MAKNFDCRVLSGWKVGFLYHRNFKAAGQRVAPFSQTSKDKPADLYNRNFCPFLLDSHARSRRPTALGGGCFFIFYPCKRVLPQILSPKCHRKLFSLHESQLLLQQKSHSEIIKFIMLTCCMPLRCCRGSFLFITYFG